MGLDKFRIRDDAKWGHPELEVAYSLMGGSVGYAEVLLNDDLSFEERQEFAKHAEDGFAQFLPEYDWTRVTAYEAPGCIDEPDAPLVKVLVANPREGKWRYKRNSPCILIIRVADLQHASVSQQPSKTGQISSVFRLQP